MSSERSGQPDYAGTVLGPRVVPATHERRTVVRNDPDPTPGVAPSNRSAADYGKFFPRGMRGNLEEIRVFCLGDAAGPLVVSISPQPGLGPTYSTTITPPAAWGWVDAAFNVMWNYDSLYVWFSLVDVNVLWGYDAVKAYDTHYTDDAGATFTDVNERMFIRAVMTGETAGDVPISGIVNVIPIPNTATESVGIAKAVAFGDWVSLVDIDGAGYCDFVEAIVSAAVNSHTSQIRVLCDRVRRYMAGFSIDRNKGYSPITKPLAIIKYKESGECRLVLTHRFEFKRRIEIQGYHATVNQNMAASIYVNLIR